MWNLQPRVPLLCQHNEVCLECSHMSSGLETPLQSEVKKNYNDKWNFECYREWMKGILLKLAFKEIAVRTHQEFGD